MSVQHIPNHERKAFRDMTPEERAAIVEAHMVGMTDIVVNGVWMHADKNSLLPAYAYRTKQRQLVIPWKHIKKEYKWAVMCSNGTVAVFQDEPRRGDDIVEWCGVECEVLSMLDIDTSGVDWKNSKTKRPEGV